MTISKLAELPRLERSLVDEALQGFASHVATNPGYADDMASYYAASVGEVIRAAKTNAEVVREPTDESALALIDQWIAVYQDEQRHGADHRRILSTLHDIRNAVAGS